MSAATVLFYVFSVLALGTGLLVVTGRNAIACAIYLVVAFFNLSGLYVMLGAQFLAATQVLVYAGAITVLILFVIMLLDISNVVHLEGSRNAAARAIGIVMIGLLAALLVPRVIKGEQGFSGQIPQGFGTAEAVGDLLFKNYLLPFEVVSILLLAAVVAAVAIAHREGGEEDSAQGGRP